MRRLRLLPLLLLLALPAFGAGVTTLLLGSGGETAFLSGHTNTASNAGSNAVATFKVDDSHN